MQPYIEVIIIRNPISHRIKWVAIHQWPRLWLSSMGAPPLPYVSSTFLQPTCESCLRRFPIATPQIGMDQVPLIDATTAGILAAVNNFKIRQRTSLMEGITGGCIEKENMYDVFDAANGVHLFTVMEKSESSERCCCAPNHSLFLEFKGVAGMGDMSKAPRAQFAGLPTVMWAEVFDLTPPHPNFTPTPPPPHLTPTPPAPRHPH